LGTRSPAPRTAANAEISVGVTYPPELLPSPDDEAEVIVVNSDGSQTIVYETTERAARRLSPPREPVHSLELGYFKRRYILETS
jgi:hypothetical protein